MKNLLSIIIPVYNEQDTIEKVLKNIIKLELFGFRKEIIIVDDCSTDKTSLILKKYAGNNIQLFTHSRNTGKGSAIKTGISVSKGKFIIIQDADLEYDPKDIQKLLRAALLHKGKIIYGSRFLEKNNDMVFGHKQANQILTLITNCLYGSKLTDMETCYKLIPREVLNKIQIESSRFNFEPEITAKILKMGKDIFECPISYEKRSFSEGKKIRWYDGVSAIWTLLKYKFI